MLQKQIAMSQGRKTVINHLGMPRTINLYTATPTIVVESPKAASSLDNVEQIQTAPSAEFMPTPQHQERTNSGNR